ncbi:hypothetical protein [Vibrio sp. L3-7]|uniref:hypothetical protein n=1 Tax=Vibrio sp. L3-7 TaxID=2912253 RepID=UPI001F2071EC|nr:hypothetical protein [Vibrio sp. L3-7]MCF7506075.1 hypothetical protein [Vibrio sp. L3-7]
MKVNPMKREAHQHTNHITNDAFKAFSWQFMSLIAKALDALDKKPEVTTILRYITAIDELYVDYSMKKLSSYHPQAPEWVTALESHITEKNTPHYLQGCSARMVALEMYFSAHPVADNVLAGLRSVLQYNPTYLDKIAAALLPSLARLKTDKATAPFSDASVAI